ncbi:MAG: PH domain-containing protein [Phaeodactylibacter sp.]|nr:PH domain-containing protein [Phaeodactylibacter sp.]
MRIEALFTRPRRQSPYAILFILLKLGRNIVRYGWPALLVILFNSKDSPWTTVYGLFLLFAVLSAISSILSYFRFYFYVQDDELIIERGLLQHTRINIPFEKIQTVNFRQNVFHQFLGVVQLEIDTAGSARSELSIEALDRIEAEQLRTFLMEKQVPVEVEQEEDARPRQTEIFRLTIRDLLRIGISQNHLRTAGIFLAFIVGLLENLEEFTGFRVYEEIGEGILHFSMAFLLRTLVLGAGLLFLSFFGSMILTVIRHYNLRLWQSDSGFKLEAGLFERREKSVQLRRIQFLKWRQNYLQRRLHLFQLSLHRAAGLQNNETRQAISIPGLRQDQVERVRKAYFPGFDPAEAQRSGISRRVIGRRFLWIGVSPLLILWLVKWNQWPVMIGISIVWLCSIWLTSIRYHRNWQFWIHPEGILTQSGIFGRQHYFLKWPHLQSIQLRQSWYQRRKGLVTLLFYTASGVVRLPYIPLQQAQAIRDYCLYTLESRPISWM